jgi:AcrR family transcriptional regulator
MQYLKDEVNQRILEAALTEFAAAGYQDTSMRQIARKAKVALGNIYRYYGNKQELFQFLVGPVYDKVFFSIQEIGRIDLKEAGAYRFNLRAKAENYFGINEVVQKLLEICQAHNQELLILLEKSKGAQAKYENTKRDVIHLLKEILENTMLPILAAEGIVPGNRYITDILASAFIEGFCVILRRYENGEEVKALTDQLINLFFKDIAQRF